MARDLDRWRTDHAPVLADERWYIGAGRWVRRRRAALAAGLLVSVTGALTGLTMDRALQGTLADQARAKWGAILDRSESGALRYRRPGHEWDDRPEDAVATAVRHLSTYGVFDTIDWRGRDDVRVLPAREREELETWLMEQAWRLADKALERPEWPEDGRRALLAIERIAGRPSAGPIAAQARALRRRLRAARSAGQPTRSRAPMAGAHLSALAAEPSRESLELYESVLAERPNLWWAHYRAGAVAFRRGDYPTAAAHLDACVRVRPRSAALRVQRAGVYYRLDRPTDALGDCDLALALEPNLAEAYRNRAFIHGRLGQAEEVEIDLERFKILTRERGAVLPLLLRFDLGDVGRLASLLRPHDRAALGREILGRDPDQAGVRLQIAFHMHQEGRDDAALAEIDRAIRACPDHLPAQLPAGGTATVGGARGGGPAPGPVPHR